MVAFSNGTLQWIPPVVSRSLCPIDVFYFPFDVQLCALVYASGSYDAAQMQIYPRDTRPDMSEYLESGEWTLVDAFYRRRILESSMMNQSFAGVVVYLCLQRRALYYFVNVVTPCTCLNLLCLASFWAPCEETGKVGLTLATMLSYFLYVNNVSERLPRSYRIPILGKWREKGCGGKEERKIRHCISKWDTKDSYFVLIASEDLEPWLENAKIRHDLQN